MILIAFLFLTIPFVCEASYEVTGLNPSVHQNTTLIGKWVRIGPSGPVSFDVKENGTVEGDFGNDGTIDIISNRADQ